jgi:CRISPR/Cas system CMR subunit Cmr4 (Cas7 group RAMP superfamily)
MKNKVFISYAHQDNHKIDQLKTELAEKGVISDDVVSFDDAQTPMIPGSSLRGLIREAVKSASTVVIFWTKNSASSDFVNYEIGMADAFEKNMVVVTPKGQKNNLPSNLSHIQVVEVDIEG